MGKKSREKKERREGVVAEPSGDPFPPAMSAFERDLFARERGDFDQIPLEVFREKGHCYPPARDVADAELPALLEQLIEDMAEVGITVMSTDHLSDRELYARLVERELIEPTELDPDGAGCFTNIDLLGGWSEEDTLIYLRYYAGDDERRDWAKDFPDLEIPPKEDPPYDRDRNLPGL